MGFFQSIFNKDKGHQTNKKEVVVSRNTSISQAKAQEQTNTEPTVVAVDSSPKICTSNSTSTTTTTTTTKSPLTLSPVLSQRASIDRPIRFQINEDGSHSHHLVLPVQNRVVASLNGLVTGLANKSLKWTERKVTQEEIIKERALLDQRLHRPSENMSLSEKWGTCQETVGKGTSGIVRVAHKIDGTGEHLYAVKELRKRTQETSKDYISRLTSEYYISSSMHHINVIRTFDLLPLNETSPIFCQIMEFPGAGDLFDVLYDCPDGLELPEANCFFKQLMRGVDYLHTIGVAHRDLKPENLLLTAQGCLKISDFGSAACFKGTAMDSDGEEEGEEDEEACSKIHLIRGLVGSEPYIAPEEFIEKNYDARAVDVWSCGIIYMALRKATHLWQVAKTGEDDAYDKYLRFRQLLDEERANAQRENSKRKALEKSMTNEQKAIEKAKREAGVLKARETIRKRAKEGRFDTLDGIDIHSKKVIYRILDPNPKKRITASEILDTDWCKSIHCCQSNE